MNTPFVQIPGLRVEVDNVMYVPTIEAPADKPFAFVYFLNIENNGSEVVTIKGRKWIVRESNGESIVVEGPGVVGESPRLKPGENFAYNSCHVVKLDAEAKGSLFGVTDGGVLFSVEIPPFTLSVPTGG